MQNRPPPATRRLLFVVYELPPIGGGVANAAQHLLTEFAKDLTLTIDVVTSSTENRFSTKAFSDNITLYYVPIGTKPPARFQSQTPLEMARFLLTSFWQITKLQFHHRYDMAHYFGYPSALNGLLYAWNMPYIVSLRGVDVPGYNQKFGWYYQLYRPFAALTWRFARALTAPSQYLADLAQKTLHTPISVIPNGVNTRLFRPLPENKKHKKFTVTAGGTIMGKKKGLDLLIKGFAQFHAQYPDTQLILFGGGDEEQTLRKLVKNLRLGKAVIFKGRVSHQKLAKELPKCHVFCLPSYAEGMSNAMIEAQAAGLAIATTPVGNGVELIKLKIALPLSYGFSSITHVLKKFYCNLKLRKEFIHRVSKSVKQNNWANMANKYLEIYLS